MELSGRLIDISLDQRTRHHPEGERVRLKFSVALDDGLSSFMRTLDSTDRQWLLFKWDQIGREVRANPEECRITIRIADGSTDALLVFIDARLMIDAGPLRRIHVPISMLRY